MQLELFIICQKCKRSKKHKLLHYIYWYDYNVCSYVKARKQQSKLNEKLKAKLLHQNKMKMNARWRVKHVLRGRNKYQYSGSKSLGCDSYTLRQYIQSKWQPGMSWSNYGKSGWVIDHIKPISLFDFSNPIEISQASHYTNLQPLWVHQNQKKVAKYSYVIN
jgi:hypothetical protein